MPFYNSDIKESF